ncbi:MAG: hypothetical protein II308_09075, partial [Muribaculaceae bacterium]|nr:hypothetical protein [Muribaculaceae bacterium]
IALITLMAHVGSFVPAKSAEIPLTDKIFTRIGASDNLISDQSTFMVEMTEVANILRIDSTARFDIGRWGYSLVENLYWKPKLSISLSCQ